MKTKNIIALMTAALVGMLSSSCNKFIFDGKGECEIAVRFKYDYNLKFADAFRSEVKSVAVYVFEPGGKFVAKAMESGASLSQDGYALVIPGLNPGRYDVVAWCGLQDADVFDVPDPATKQDLLCRIKTKSRTKATENYSDAYLGSLYHGMVENVDLKNLPEGSMSTVVVPLMKDTNNIRVLLQSFNSDINLTPDQFTFAIYDYNGELDYKNENSSFKAITYDPFATSQGKVTLNDGTEALTAAMAEFSVGRLFTRLTDKARLVITQVSTGKEIFNVPLVDYFVMVKGHYAFDMGSQEYLDRQDDYSMVIFLEHREGPAEEFIAARVYINGWQIVYSNPDIF